MEAARVARRLRDSPSERGGSWLTVSGGRSGETVDTSIHAFLFLIIIIIYYYHY